jgi:pre-mRNA-splicing factor ATP-dependent RNA helicase DHX38/PRP16
MKDDPIIDAEWQQREEEIDQQWYDADEDGAV